MLEKYYKYKVNYNEYIVLIKVGNFYECFNNDALILNSIFNYKIKRIKNSFKVGFPTSGIDGATKKLKELNLSYIIVNNDDIKEYNDDNNKYKNYNYNLDVINYNYMRVEKINNYLNDNILNDNISNILSEIEKKIMD